MAAGIIKPTSTIVDAPICLGNWCPQNYTRSYSGTVTVTHALMKSINTIPVRLSVMLGASPKAGRAKIIEMARKMGLRTSLPDSSSLPIGAAEVTVLDHTAGYTAFPNLGKAATPHAILEVRTGNGELVWRFDRDGKQPEQVFRPQVALDMNMMLNKAVEEGTGRRALLDGIKVAGKTGTTNAYRDAWFVAYTGNYVAGVWFGNDDYSPTNRMTGGSLPAMTWRQIMHYAHQGIEVKALPGAAPGPTPAPPQAAVATANTKAADTLPRPAVLTKRGADVLTRVERLMDDAARALAPAPASPVAAASDQRADASASAPSRPPAGH
jgi:penicillin-binding protein 1A